MARKKNTKSDDSADEFIKELEQLHERIADDLMVPSLHERPPRLRGFAFEYALVLPLLSSSGKEVFTERHLVPLNRLLTERFGGCLATASSSHPPLYGFYQPKGRDPEKDYHTQLVILANPIDASDQFFTGLKQILRSAPLIEQEEILIKRYDVRLT